MDFNQIERDSAILRSLELDEARQLWKQFVMPNGPQVYLFWFFFQKK